MAVMHSSPVCLVTILILDHLEVEFTAASVGLAAEVPSGFAAACGGKPPRESGSLVTLYLQLHTVKHFIISLLC